MTTWIKVFPTQVGVILMEMRGIEPLSSIPHTGRGDPETFKKKFILFRYSPRRWG